MRSIPTSSCECLTLATAHRLSAWQLPLSPCTELQHVQGCDTKNFPKFKMGARMAKSDRLCELVRKGIRYSLKQEDMPYVIKEPWEAAFHPAVNRSAWDSIGFDTASGAINRRVY